MYFKRFMEIGRLDVPEINDPKWIMDLAFLLDMTQELKILNLDLQDPGQLITTAYETELCKTQRCGFLFCSLRTLPWASNETTPAHLRLRLLLSM